MIFQITDLIVPLIFIFVIAGYQISAYFLYQYYKFKKEKLVLNRILLSYSSFFGLGLTGILLRNINRYFIEEYMFKTFFLKLSNFLFIMAVLLFLFFITSKSFNEIVNSNITKIICYINIIPLICIFLFQSDSPILLSIFMITIMGILFMFFFQLKLIKNSTKNIKTRLIFILIGQMLLGGDMFIGGEFFRENFFVETEELFVVLMIFVSIIALMLIFLGVFNFPAILEIEWKNYLLKFIVVNQEDFKILYQFDFSSIPENIINLDEESSDHIKKEVFFSRGILGIEEIVSGLTSMDKGRINKIKQGDIILYLNQGDGALSHIIYCLIVNKELLSYEYFLKEAKRQFQEIYRNILIKKTIKYEDLINITKGFDNTIKIIVD